jgi:Tfp pilus assembly protein PilF
MSLHQSGAFDAAEKEYRRALKRAPERADILHLTGLAAHQSGRNLDAVKLIRRAIKRAPREISYRVNQAIVLNALGRWQEAEKACRAALKLQPGHGEAHNNLGRALAGLGRTAAAAAAYQAAIEAGGLGGVAYNNLGLLHMQNGATTEAAECFRSAIKINPNFTLALTNLATVCLSAGRLDEAEQACRQALAAEPDLVAAWHSLATVKSARGEHAEAEALFEKVLGLDPGHGLARINLGSVKLAEGKYADAEAHFRGVLRSAPESGEAHLNLGSCLADQGNLDEALQCFRRTIALDPRNIEAYYALATSSQPHFDATSRANIEALARTKGLNLDAQVKLQFVLAAIAFGDNDRSLGFHYCRQGNKIRQILLAEDGQSFDAAGHSAHLDAVAQTFSASFLDARSDWGEADARPIFIVGMPRSGTTLAERIIAAHPGVQGLGERSDIPAVMQRAADILGEDAGFLDGISELSRDQLSDLARAHLNAVSRLAPSGIMVADKMPFNFINLGFIQLLFPDARIIHCRRGPLDVGLSCYLTNFVQPHSWSCDLGHIGHYIKAHDRLMDHWRSVLSIEIFDWNYETVVADTESEARRLIDYLGLDWEPACLEFHAGEGAVQSASKWQVRSPVTSAPVGRWRDFADDLSPLIEVLGVEI